MWLASLAINFQQSFYSFHAHYFIGFSWQFLSVCWEPKLKIWCTLNNFWQLKIYWKYPYGYLYWETSFLNLLLHTFSILGAKMAIQGKVLRIRTLVNRMVNFFSFILVLFVLLILFVCFDVCILFWEKEYEVQWIGRWEWSGRSRQTNIFYEKILHNL